ncbi:hypothetical protein DL768_006978 [Monosporascus sp. mg162]|nr:hypothetical protein DL768_006978 [Monosporascus sp. mg162]
MSSKILVPGKQIREHLAWVRTALGFVVPGLAVERFSQLDIGELLSAPAVKHRRQQHQPPPPPQRDKEQDHYLVGALTGLGAGSVLYGAGRYFLNLRSFERGEFRPAYRGAAVLDGLRRGPRGKRVRGCFEEEGREGRKGGLIGGL